MMVALIFGVFVLVLLIGCPIAIALLLGGIVPIMALTDIPLGIVVQRLFSSANSYSMMAVPFFILAGNLMDTGGVSKRLVNLARSLVGWLPPSRALYHYCGHRTKRVGHGSVSGIVAGGVGGLVRSRRHASNGITPIERIAPHREHSTREEHSSI